ncbi:MAG: hypothetical protein N3D09_04020 [Archaeoglobaceae archaeon]|nr:hypothetical protein [Archaeoglobaceae archaeon]
MAKKGEDCSRTLKSSPKLKTTKSYEHKNPFVWTEEKGRRRLRKQNKPLKTKVAYNGL